MDTNPAPVATLTALASKWAAMHPDLSNRLDRALALVANVTQGDINPNVYFVEGSEGAKYTVRVNRVRKTSTCTCPDHQNRQLRCKHILAVALVVAGS